MLLQVSMLRDESFRRSTPRLMAQRYFAEIKYALKGSFICTIESLYQSLLDGPSQIELLKLSFSANLSHRAYLFFSWTDSTDYPDCLPSFLGISVFTF